MPNYPDKDQIRKQLEYLFPKDKKLKPIPGLRKIDVARGADLPPSMITKVLRDYPGNLDEYTCIKFGRYFKRLLSKYPDLEPCHAN